MPDNIHTSAMSAILFLYMAELTILRGFFALPNRPGKNDSLVVYSELYYSVIPVRVLWSMRPQSGL